MAKNNENIPAIAIRSNCGVEVWQSTGFKQPYVPDEKFTRDESKFCRAIVFSPEGRFFAWGNGTNVHICKTTSWEKLCTLPRPKAFSMKFSPKGTYLMTWEIFTTNKDNPEGGPNLFIYKSETGEEVFSTIQKKQTDWEPFWSADETLLCMMLGGEVFFYELNTPEGFTTPTRKLGGGKNGKFSLSPGNKNFYVFYVPGTKGSPSMCKLYLYPTVNTTQAITCKSFFQSDKVEMLWNKRGTDILLLTSTDIDQTGASYYGKQALHFMSTKGDSYSVTLGKEGPIHAVEWSSKSTEFCVIYGYMPATATIFNLKCDVVMDFQPGPRNSIYYNSFGNILLLAGFGNLRGNIEVWDMTKKKLITNIQAPDSTYLEWHPNGEVFMTATTAPRLRMSNGFKLWHYSGALLHETLWPQELYEVLWQKYPDDVFKVPTISNEKVEGIQSSVALPSAQIYRPPNVRLGIEIPDEPAKKPKPKIPGLFPDKKGSERKDRPKNKRDYKKKNFSKEENQNTPDKPAGNTEQRQSTSDGQEKRQSTSDSKETSTSNTTNAPSAQQPRRPNNNRNNYNFRRNNPPKKEQGSTEEPAQGAEKPKKKHMESTGDPEKDKRIIYIQRQLQKIRRLKGKQGEGKQLLDTQVNKISEESNLIKELKQLTVSS